jgi:tetratricopeptide (TPR) repeat protein
VRCRTLSLLLAVATLTGVAQAQQLRVLAPIGGEIPATQPDEDLGVPVELVENPNLDRYLRRAQAFLEAAKFDAAIEVLQAVIEGQTIEFRGPSGDGGKTETGAAGPATEMQDNAKTDSAPKAGAGQQDKPGSDKPSTGKTGNRPSTDAVPAAQGSRSPIEIDAAAAVFSSDGRIYRPVRRLCHEILATLPAAGIELYRASFEPAAAEMLEAALADGSTTALERVPSRFFITVAAGKAMQLLADRLMQEGRYRSAVQVLRDLVELYPEENRRRLGLNPAWCQFKIALCLRLAGDHPASHAAVTALAEKFPEDSLRLAGELQPIRGLPGSSVFANAVVEQIAAPQIEAAITSIDAATEQLVPLWQFRFRNPDPYRDPKSGGGERNVWVEGGQVNTMPHASRHAPGTWVTWSRGSASEPPRALYFEHFRLRVADTFSGLQLLETDALSEPPPPRDNHSRARIAATDHALLRPIHDEERIYAVLGFPRSTLSQSIDVLKSSELVAYDRADLKKRWSSAQWTDGDQGLRDVTFLAAPTIFGERLLLPALRRGHYTLQCIDRNSGQPMWHTTLHSGGTPFLKAPGVPVVVAGGIAYVATNAGCVAAVDAFIGELRWVRRYEREDPLRPRPRSKTKGSAEGRGINRALTFSQQDLAGFWPSDLLVQDGQVILAPCDSPLVMCLDGASGQLLWYVDASSRHLNLSQLRTIVGANSQDLFLLGDRHLVCVGRHSGLLRWSIELPQWSGQRNVGRGRGTLLGDQILVPGERELLVIDASGKQTIRRLPLPPFAPAREPMAGPFTITADGPWLALGYAGGVETYSSVGALRQLAVATTEPLRRAEILMLVGDQAAAESTLIACIRDTNTNAELQKAATARLLALAQRRAMNLAQQSLDDALKSLDPLLHYTTDPQLRRNWHLARIEVCKQAGDLLTHEREQQRLYDYMEGRG